jgi:hypothetical protein
LNDTLENTFNGAGKVNQNGFRDYEFQMNFTNGNDTGNVSLSVSNQYAMYFGLNNSVISTAGNYTEPLLVQIGPRIVAAPTGWTAFIINMDSVILYILFIVLAFYVVYGFILVRSRKNIDYTAIADSRLAKPESPESNEPKPKVKQSNKERRK